MSTPALRDLQHDFWRALSATPGTSAARPAFLDSLEHGPQLDAEERLQIYVNAYLWRLQQVLRETFPRLAARLTSAELHDLTTAYLQRHPSRHPSIGYAGRHLAEFLPSYRLPPYLCDLARLEWARATVFEAEDAVLVSANTLRAVAPEDWPALRFMSLPALQVLDLGYPVHLLWGDEAAAVDMAQATRLRVWRTADYRVMHSVLDARESVALESLRRGESFAVICEAFADLGQDEAAQQSISLLLRWLEDGILAVAV